MSVRAPGETEVQRRVLSRQVPRERDDWHTGRDGPWDAAVNDAFVLVFCFV